MDIILTRQRKEKATALEMIKQTSVKKAIVRRLSCHCLSPSRSLPIIPRGLSFFLSPASLLSGSARPWRKRVFGCVKFSIALEVLLHDLLPAWWQGMYHMISWSRNFLCFYQLARKFYLVCGRVGGWEPLIHLKVLVFQPGCDEFYKRGRRCET